MPVPYQRMRALLVHLMPPSHRDVMPVAPPAPGPDDAYRPCLPDTGFPRCAEVGLLDAPAPPPGTPDVVLRRLTVLEDWLTTMAP